MSELAIPKLPPPPGPALPPDLVGGGGPGPHPYAPVVRDLVCEALWQDAATDPRSRQRSIGPSDLGQECDRARAYGRAGVTPVHFPDPLRVQAGKAFHGLLADIFARADAGAGRYLVETRVSYRGIIGTADFYDRRRALLLDWKTTTKSSRKMRMNGIPDARNLIQVATYGLGLREAGEAVELVGLVYIPLDGELKDIRVWVGGLTHELVAQVDEAIDRVNAQAGLAPADAPNHPSALCGWCSWHRPGSTDLSTACPGT